MMICFYKLHKKVEEVMGGQFERYGRFVARHPWKTTIIVGFLNLLLGLGLLRINSESGIDQYVPLGSQAIKDETTVRSLFGVNTTEDFYIQSLPDLGLYGEIIVEMKSQENILNNAHWSELRDIINVIQNISVQDSSGSVYKFEDLCAKRNKSCVIDGEFLLELDFVNNMTFGVISYPYYNLSTGETVIIDRFIGGLSHNNNFITEAKALKFRFNLNVENFDLSRKWEETFVKKLGQYTSKSLNVKYSYSDSLSVELSNNVSGDITVFSITFTLMIVFACFALMGTNCVDNRYNLGLAGVLSTCLAILSAFGLASLCGAVFVDIVGIMPFLILGIGVDDMFILLSGLADTSSTDDVETRIGRTMRTSGIAITITSITDIVAFCAGAASVFPSVRNFSWYTGCAVLFCYFNYVTFYIGVMTINEQRVTRKLHWLTCCTTKSKQELKESGKAGILVFLCGGKPRETREDVEGPIEKYPKKLLKKIILNKYSKAIIVLLFLCYIGVSSWGAKNFQEGLDLRNLVSPDSYHYKFYDTNIRLFSQNIFISFNIREPLNYTDNINVQKVKNLLNSSKADMDIHSTFQLSWLDSYSKSIQYNNTSYSNFIQGLQTFLMNQGQVFSNDVVLDNNTISASRFHVLSSSLVESTAQAALMVRMRNLADSSPLPVFAFSSSFKYYEQYVQIVPQTIQTLAIAVSVVFLVTALFMPLPTLILLVTMSVSMIMVGVIGFMEIWDLTLSSVTMIHIVMCVGFSVDFSAHICHAFVQSSGEFRNDRVESALDLAGGPILNGALSSVIGILMLAFSKSYIFFSFFKVMFIVVVVGALHALFLLPVLLSLVGPLYGPSTTEHKDTAHNNQDKLDGRTKSGGSNSQIYINEPYKIPRPKLFEQPQDIYTDIQISKDTNTVEMTKS